jgi:hypothetical protein
MLQLHQETIREYYTRQSAITDPGQYAYLFDDLPADLPNLVKIVQGLLIFPFARHHGLPVLDERRSELHLRTIPKMIEGILALDPTPLTTTRPPEKRLYGLCRDFAVLLAAMLRHQGTPARERVGFAGYFNSDWYWDHRITEYWDAPQQRWLLVDPRIDEVERSALRRKIDPLQITRHSPFLLADEAWQMCRAGQADPDLFVDSPTDRGMPMIRYALLHDFDALNKVELVGMDAWHALIDKPEEEVTEADRTLLDQIAGITLDVDARFAELQTLYAITPYGQAVRKQLDMQPIEGYRT